MTCKTFLNYCWYIVKTIYTEHKAYYNAICILRKSGFYEVVDLEHAEWIAHISERTTLNLYEALELYELAHNIFGLTKEDVVRLYPNDGKDLYNFKVALIKGEYL